MILAGRLDQVEATTPKPWRAHAAVDADNAATTQRQFVDETRRDGVRTSVAVLRGAHAFSYYPPADRQADVLRILAASVEKQARVSGVGRITLPVSASGPVIA